MCVCIKDKKSCFFLFLYDQRRNVYTKSPLLFASIHPSPRLNKKKNKTPKELEKKVNHSFPSSSSIYTLVDTCKCGVTKWASQSRLFSFFFSLCVWSKMTRRSSPAGFFFFLSSFFFDFYLYFFVLYIKRWKSPSKIQAAPRKSTYVHWNAVISSAKKLSKGNNKKSWLWWWWWSYPILSYPILEKT